MMYDLIKFTIKHRNVIHSAIAWRREIRAGMSFILFALSSAIRPKEKKINDDWIFIF